MNNTNATPKVKRACACGDPQCGRRVSKAALAQKIEVWVDRAVEAGEDCVEADFEGELEGEEREYAVLQSALEALENGEWLEQEGGCEEEAEEYDRRCKAKWGEGTAGDYYTETCAGRLETRAVEGAHTRVEELARAVGSSK